MNRTELEIKLNQDRAWTLETFAALSEAELNCDLKPSRHNAESKWTAKDHLAHLIGIEIVFNKIIKRHLEGQANAIGIVVKEDGTRRSQEEIMAIVHAMNEQWIIEHHDKSFNEIAALGQKVRAETLTLIAGLSDEQLNEKITGAPWADASISGILAVNGDHARQHYGWVKAALT